MIPMHKNIKEVLMRDMKIIRKLCFNDITPKDIVTDEWNRGYVEGFNAAKNRK